MKKVMYKDLNGKEHEVNTSVLVHASRILWHRYLDADNKNTKEMYNELHALVCAVLNGIAYTVEK